MNTHSQIAFSERQREVAFRKKQEKLDAMWRELRKTSEDAYVYLHKLMFDLYEADKAGRNMTMGEACNAIPVKHESTCKKYIDYAKSERLIAFRAHPLDKRKTLVVPTSKLKQFVEDEIRRECLELESIAKEFGAK